jgi:hypothetical protein
MELLAGAIAIYLIAKVGWPVVKFIGGIVIICMVMQSCSAHAQPATPERYAPCAHFADREAYVRCCWERPPVGHGAISPDRIRLGEPMEIKCER